MKNNGKVLLSFLIFGFMSLVIGIPTYAANRPISNGYYMIESGNSSDRVLDIHDNSMVNRGNLEIYKKNNTTNQIFYVEYLGDGYYTLQAIHSGLYVQKVGTTDDVHQWEGHSNYNSHWLLESAGSGYYYLQCRSSGKYLDNNNAKTSLGNNVGTYNLNHTNAQKWKFISVNRPSFDVKLSNSEMPSGNYTKTQSKKISGKITANYPVTKMEIAVYNKAGKLVKHQTANPNKLSFTYSLNIDFSVFNLGDYYSQIRVWDVKGDVSNSKKYYFSVISPVTGIELNQKSVSLYIGNTYVLKAAILPSDASNKTIRWESSNTSVATVDSKGKVTAKKIGTATIKAKSNNGKYASAKITVIAKRVTAVKGGQAVYNFAKTQVGKKYTSFPKKLGFNSGKWCADFVSYCASNAKQSKAIPKRSSVDGIRSAIKKAGGKEYSKATVKKGKYTPKCGDIIIFKGGMSHVGIVNKTSGGKIYYIDGNNVSKGKGNLSRVCSTSCSVSASKFTCVLKPNYK